MKDSRAKTGPHKSRDPVQDKRPDSLYAGALPGEELLRLASQASLADELLLLRAQVRRLALRIDLDDLGSGLKQLHVLTRMICAIAAIERIRLQKCSGEAALGASLSRAVDGVNPREHL